MQPDPTTTSDTERFFLDRIADGSIGITPEGRIMRLVDRRNNTRCDPPIPIDGRRRDGYLSITARHQQRTLSMTSHRLVYLHFVVPIPVGMEINHKDGDKSNNRPDNLEVVTRSGNMRHAFASGLNTPRLGEKAGRSGVSDADALEIRRAYAAREANQYQLAARYGVSQAAISYIVRGDVRTWQGGSTSGDNHMKKLTREQHAEIIAFCESGALTKQQIGDRYGVSRAAIGYIIKAAARRASAGAAS